MDQAALVVFFHWLLLALMVITLVVVFMAFSGMARSTSSYDDETEAGGHH